MVTSKSWLLSLFLLIVCCHRRGVICGNVWWSWRPLVRGAYAGLLILGLCQVNIRWWMGSSLWGWIGWRLYCFLSDIAVNLLVTAMVFFHWLSWSFSLSRTFILSLVCLLISPISDFVGLINRYDRLVLKFNWLWFDFKKGWLFGYTVYFV